MPINIDEKIYIDALTGLYNRYFFEKKFSEEVQRANRNKIPFSIIIFDIDFFKQYNDTFGHEEGDRALVAIARTIRQNIREIDFPFRIGGEEFLILLPYTDSLGAYLVAEKIRKKVEEIDYLKRKITISGGIATYFRDTYNPKELFSIADKKLYQAKELGRNRIIFEKEENSLLDKVEFWIYKQWAFFKLRKKRLVFYFFFFILLLSFIFGYLYFLTKIKGNWKLVYKENFTPFSFNLYWNKTSGKWKLEGKEFVAEPSKTPSFLLTNKFNIIGDYRIIMKGYFEKDVKISDLSLYVNGTKNNPKNGYFIGIGTNGNSRNKILKQGKEVCVSLGEKLLPEKKYLVIVEKVGDHIKVWLNRKLLFNYWDFFPLNNLTHNKISIYTFYPGLHITRFEIYTRQNQLLVPIFSIPDRLFTLHHYEEAYKEYKILLDKVSDGKDLLKFKCALCLLKLKKEDESQKYLEEIIYTGKNVSLIPYAKMELVNLSIEKGEFSQALNLMRNILDEYKNRKDIFSVYNAFLCNVAFSISPFAPSEANNFINLYLEHQTEDRFGRANIIIQKMKNELMMEKYKEVEKNYMKLLQNYTDYRDILFTAELLYAKNLFLQKKYNEAFEHLESLDEKYKDLYYALPQKYDTYAHFLFYLRDINRFKFFYEEISRKYPGNQNKYIVKVKTLWAFLNILKGNEDYGISILNSITHSIPSNSDIGFYPHLYLGYYYFQKKYYELARKEFVYLLDFIDSYPYYKDKIDILIGLCYLNENLTVNAELWFEKILKDLLPYSIEYYVAEYMLYKIFPQQLILYLSKYKLYENDAYFYIAEKFESNGDFESAKSYYEKCKKVSLFNEYPFFIVDYKLKYLEEGSHSNF